MASPVIPHSIYHATDSPASSRSNSPGSEVYALPMPVENAETERLDVQHEVFKMMVGGLYPDKEAVHKALAPKLGVQRAILDLGSGSGSWAVAMALEFPHAQVLGIDLAPHVPLNTPGNCRFKIADFNVGLSHLKGQFDVVHGRCIGSGSLNYQFGLHRMMEYLRPGGLLILGEGTLHVFSESKNAVPPSSSNFARMIHEYREFNASQGNPIEWEHMIEIWLEQNSQQYRTYTFENIIRRDYYSPIGWAGLDEDRLQGGDRIGYLTGKNCQSFVRALRTALLARGFDQDVISDWVARVDDELASSDTRMYLKWQFVWAVRGEQS